MMDESIKNRLRLWLLSERAMGLSIAGPGTWPEPSAVQPAAAASPRLEQPRSAATPPIHAVAAPIVAPRQAPDSAPAISPLAGKPASGVESEPFTSPILSLEDRRAFLATLDQTQVQECVKCELCRSRHKTVFGEGAADARLMFIGEGPGSKEDQTGRPFVGPAGELLNRMIGAMGLAREQVYIANIVKCRAFLPGPPPKDRAPSPEEVAACSPYLLQQVETIRPNVIVTLGVPATQFILQTKLSMSRLRGTWNAWHGIKVMPTWHPSYLLRREKEGDTQPKRQAWGDLQLVMKELGLAVPKKSE
jgi:DNA polymerase